MDVITALIGIMFILTAPSVVLIIMVQPVEQSFGTHMEDVTHHVLLSIGCIYLCCRKPGVTLFKSVGVSVIAT